MSPKPATPVTLVPPLAPGEAVVADDAKSGHVDEFKRSAIEKAKGKTSSTKCPPHKPPKTQEEKARKLSWIEIELVDEENQPVPGARYRVTLPDGTADEGALDAKGFARVDGFEAGTCQVTFPELDKDAWEKL
jgi:hypothetical protein